MEKKAEIMGIVGLYREYKRKVQPRGPKYSIIRCLGLGYCTVQVLGKYMIIRHLVR